MQIDVASYIGAMTREVRGRDHEGKPARVVVASRSYDTTLDDLWDALTSAERIPRWFLPITGDLKLGGRYQLVGNAGGTITACEPPRRLSLTWEFGGQTSWVNVSLTADGAGTHLELEHIAHIADPDEFARRVAAAGYSTDPAYAQKLISLMQRYDLYRFDSPG